MTTLAEPRERTDPSVPRVTTAPWAPWTVVGFAVLAVLVRLPFLGTPVSSDEGGFLYLARHWTDTGGSLYGRYWVDRPPLLLALFRAGDLLGGLTGLRVLGCLAVGVAVLALGLTAQRALGSRAAAWTSATACAVLTTPLLGALNVNGELLASPFVALGLLATVHSLTATSDSRRTTLALAAGVCAASALMVKQNFVDVAVFAAVLALTTRRRGLVGVRQVTGFLVGAGVALSLVLAAAAARGTSPTGVFWAMYPFRLKAAGLMGHAPLTDRIHHLETLGTSWLVSGAPLLVLALVAVTVRGRLRRYPLARPIALATLALTGFDLLSVAAGGSYWTHYLVQLAPVTALAAGLVAATRSGRVVTSLVLAVAALTWGGALTHRVEAPGQTVGQAIGAVSQPGDTVVSLLGNPDIVQASGLTSPYRYLWSLPSRTLDPQWTLLAATLRGPHAPTWVVVRGSRTLAELEAAAPGQVLTERYQPVSQVCGRQVYLRTGVDRSPPQAVDCRRPLSTWFTSPTTGTLR